MTRPGVPSVGRRARGLAALGSTVLAVGPVACIDRRDEPVAATCADDPAPPTWSLVSAAVMQPSCGSASCHSALSRRAGVVLDSAAAGYTSLVAAEPEPFVRAGLPAESRLMYLLAGVDVARMMPPSEPLPTVDIELVARWICAGAEDD